MRVTDSRLDLASSHAYTASLEAHRQVQAWDQTGRVEMTDDVKITLSSAEAAVQLGDSARDLAAGRGFGPGLGRGMGLGNGFGNGRGLGIGNGVSAMRAPAMTAPPVSAPAVPEEEEPDPTEAEITRQAWMLLIRMAGDEEGAVRLAKQLSAFARRMEGAGDIAAVLDRVAAKYGGAEAQAARAASAAQAAPAESWGYREDISVKVTQSESVSFAAAARVTTADGRQINVAAAFSMAQTSITEITASVRKGAALHDPLALSFTTAAPSLGSGTQQVDVNNDGAAESVASLAPGTAYLVRDLNGNGVVDGGSEMFGPASGDGFGELAALDSDGSGWVDEGDAAFAQLSLWDGNEGSALTSLAHAGVGALATQNIATQYAYGASSGTLAASSIFLYEDGRAGFTGELELYA